MISLYKIEKHKKAFLNHKISYKNHKYLLLVFWYISKMKVTHYTIYKPILYIGFNRLSPENILQIITYTPRLWISIIICITIYMYHNLNYLSWLYTCFWHFPPIIHNQMRITIIKWFVCSLELILWIYFLLYGYCNKRLFDNYFQITLQKREQHIRKSETAELLTKT